MKNMIHFYEKDAIEILFANSEHNFPLHSHDSFCFGIVEEGEVTFTIQGKQRLLYPGNAYIIPSNVEVASQYIRKYAHEKFSLDTLADAIHVSKYYLVKLFKKEMGVTPNQYYIQIRMYLVKKEIIKYRKEVDLAMELNFNDQSHLCNLFKKQMGISLLDYKKSFRRLE